MGVYLLLSALDFPFCFLAVRLLGTDRIGQAEKAVIDMFWRLVEVPFPNARMGREQAKEVIDEAVSDPATREGKGWGVEAAQERNRGEEASMLLLYMRKSLHKVTDMGARSYNSTSTGIRDPQVFHLHPGAADRCRDPKGGQNAQGLGLEHWKEKTKDAVRRTGPPQAVTYLYKSILRLGACIEGLGKGWLHNCSLIQQPGIRSMSLEFAMPSWHLDRHLRKDADSSPNEPRQACTRLLLPPNHPFWQPFSLWYC